MAECVITGPSTGQHCHFEHTSAPAAVIVVHTASSWAPHFFSECLPSMFFTSVSGASELLPFKVKWQTVVCINNCLIKLLICKTSQSGCNSIYFRNVILLFFSKKFKIERQIRPEPIFSKSAPVAQRLRSVPTVSCRSCRHRFESPPGHFRCELEANT